MRGLTAAPMLEARTSHATLLQGILLGHGSFPCSQGVSAGGLDPCTTVWRRAGRVWGRSVDDARMRCRVFTGWYFFADPAHGTFDEPTVGRRSRMVQTSGPSSWRAPSARLNRMTTQATSGPNGSVGDWSRPGTMVSPRVHGQNAGLCPRPGVHRAAALVERSTHGTWGWGAPSGRCSGALRPALAAALPAGHSATQSRAIAWTS
jgi:hypothetical protein